MSKLNVSAPRYHIKRDTILDDGKAEIRLRCGEEMTSEVGETNLSTIR